LARLNQPDLSTVFTESTGGRAAGFVTRNALEKTIQLIGEEVHRQYLVSFEPKGNVPGSYHAIRVEVKNRPGLKIRTRAGYWAVE
jgi:hypothetical protein